MGMYSCILDSVSFFWWLQTHPQLTVNHLYIFMVRLPKTHIQVRRYDQHKPNGSKKLSEG
jgi:hypothetical protein